MISALNCKYGVSIVHQEKGMVLSIWVILETSWMDSIDFVVFPIF